MRPKALDDFGLVPALERLTGPFSEQTGIGVAPRVSPAGEPPPEETETALYRVVQEALTNIVVQAGGARERRSCTRSRVGSRC